MDETIFSIIRGEENAFLYEYISPLAGLIYDTLKRMPEEEEVLEVDGLRIIVKKMKGPKIVLAKVLKLD